MYFPSALVILTQPFPRIHHWLTRNQYESAVWDVLNKRELWKGFNVERDVQWQPVTPVEECVTCRTRMRCYITVDVCRREPDQGFSVGLGGGDSKEGSLGLRKNWVDVMTSRRLWWHLPQEAAGLTPTVMISGFRLCSRYVCRPTTSVTCVENPHWFPAVSV